MARNLKHQKLLPANEVTVLVGRYSRMGFTAGEIAQKLCVAIREVEQTLSEIRKRYKEAHKHEDRPELIAEKVEQYQDIIREAYTSWEHSKRVCKKIVTERVPVITKIEYEDDTGKKCVETKVEIRVVKKVITKQQRLPAAQYMNIILEALQAIRDLKGLDAPKKQDLRSLNMDWNQLMQEVSAQLPSEVPDLIEQRIAAMEAEATTMKDGTEPTLTLVNPPLSEVPEGLDDFKEGRATLEVDSPHQGRVTERASNSTSLPYGLKELPKANGA